MSHTQRTIGRANEAQRAALRRFGSAERLRAGTWIGGRDADLLAFASRLVAALPEPIALLRGDGADWFANPPLERMLRECAARAAVTARLRDIAAAVVHAAPVRGTVEQHVTVDVDASDDAFEVCAAWIGVGLTVREGLALLRVHRSAAAAFDARVRRFGLTPRQATVARLLAQGLSNAAIARRLCVSPHTVRHHVEQVLLKVGASSRGQAVAMLTASGAPVRAGRSCEPEARTSH